MAAEYRAQRDELLAALRVGLEAVRKELQTAYNRATPVCCQRPGMECCGCPELDWTKEDQALMDSLGKAERVMSAAITKSQEQA